MPGQVPGAAAFLGLQTLNHIQAAPCGVQHCAFNDVPAALKVRSGQKLSYYKDPSRLRTVVLPLIWHPLKLMLGPQSFSFAWMQYEFWLIST